MSDCYGWVGRGGGGGVSQFTMFLPLFLFVCLSSFVYPEGRPGMSDLTLLSGISGLSFESPFLSCLSFLCLVLLLFLSGHFNANRPFSCLFVRLVLSTFSPR